MNEPDKNAFRRACGRAVALWSFAGLALAAFGRQGPNEVPNVEYFNEICRLGIYFRPVNGLTVDKLTAPAGAYITSAGCEEGVYYVAGAKVAAEGVGFKLDNRTGTRTLTSVDELLPIAYSGSGWTGKAGAATVAFTGTYAGEVVAGETTTGATVWRPLYGGTYTLTHGTTASATTNTATIVIPYHLLDKGDGTEPLGEVAQALSDAIGANGYVEKREGIWTIVVTNNVVDGLVLPDNLGEIAIDLNGHDILGTNGVAGTETTPGGNGGAATRPAMAARA